MQAKALGEYGNATLKSEGHTETEGLLDRIRLATLEADMGLGGLVTRRTAISLLGGSALAAAFAGRAEAASNSHTLWMLDPEWGSSLTTPSGSDTKSRCRGRACHLAAPHRFFLSRTDAISGRLHPCCLAQPVAVTVCIDLNLLLPYYSARLGGVDTRCAQLPDSLRAALTGRSACGLPDDDQEPEIAAPSALPTFPGSTAGARSAASTLPATGSATTLALGAVVAVAAGAVVLATTERSDDA